MRLKAFVNRTKGRKKYVPGYFTVEASLVLPVVFACYLLVAVLLCYIYERCILEQNACRLPVWEKYVEGYLNLYPENAGKISREQICEYILKCLAEEERERYLLGQSVQADMNMRGERFHVERSFAYTQFGKWKQEVTVTSYCLDPEEYIRTVNLLKKITAEGEDTGEGGDVEEKKETET